MPPAERATLGQNPHDPRLVLTTAAAPTVLQRSPGPRALAALRSPWTGWMAGILVFVALGFSCLDLAPWSLALLPLLVLAGFLAARSAEEWPRIGFPVCILGVALFVIASGLFKSGVTWAREWDTLRNAGTLGVDPGMSPVLGMVLAVALGGAFLGVLFLHGDTVWRSLSSVRLAVVTLASIGTLSVIGTMVVQRFGAGALPGPEQEFVEKFMKGQGAIPVNARFMLSPPEVKLSAAEQEKVDLTALAFGEGKGRTMNLGLHDMHGRNLKAQAIDDHVKARREHLLNLFQRLDTLGFTNVFRTWWFNALLVLLFVQVVAVINKRYPWGWMNTGWVLTHIGVLVILAGCVISDGFLKDGSLALSPDQVMDRFQEYTRLDANGEPEKTELGYRVRMLGTDQSFWHQMEIVLPGVQVGEDVLWTTEQIRPGRRFTVRDPGGKATYDISVQETWERALLETVMASGKAVGRGGGEPVVRVRFLRRAGPGGTGERVMADGYLFASGRFSGGIPSTLVRYLQAGTAEEAAALVAGKPPEGQGKHGTLRVRVPGDPGVLAVPATPGASAAITGADGVRWTVTVKGFDPYYLLGKEEAAADPDALPMNPALAIEVAKSSGDGMATTGSTHVYANPDLQAQWLEMTRSGTDSSHGAPKAGYGPAAEVSCEFEFIAPLLVVEGPGIPRTLVFHRRGGAPLTADFSAPGATFDKGPGGLAFRMVEAIPDAVPDERIQPLPQETDDQYLRTCLETLETGVEPSPTVAVAKIEVAEKDEAGSRTRTAWLVAGKKGVAEPRSFRSTDGRLFLDMVETNSAMMFRSALEVQSRDGKPVLVDGNPLRKVVRVNHPLQWGGYAFYQNSFVPATPPSPGNPGSPEASVFRVKYDRGIPTIYAGFITLVTGVCMMLYLKPLFRRKRGAEGKAAAAAGKA